MRPFQFFTVRSKLIFAFLVVTLFPLMLLAVLNQKTTQKALTNNANQRLLTAASQTALSIDAFITTNLDAIRVEAQLPILAKYLISPANQRQRLQAEVEGTLRALNRKDTLNIASYGLLDLQGRIVIDTYTPDIYKSRATEDYVQQPLKTGLPYASALRYKPDEDVPSLYFSSPVRDASGKILGLLRVRYNATVIQRLISQNTDVVGTSDAFAILLDENHIRLAQGYSPELIFKSVVPLPPEKLKLLQIQRRLPKGSAADLSTNLPAFERGLNNAENSPFFTSFINPNSKDKKAAAVIKLKTKPWYVVFVQSESAFLAPIQAQVRNTVILAVVIAGIVVIVAIAMGQLLTKPLIYLTETVTDFTAGNLEARANIQSKDEIGVLTSSFNKMAEQVSKLLQGLEERTRELEASQHVTAAVSQLSKVILEPKLLLREAIALMQNRFSLHAVQIYLLDQKTFQLIETADFDEQGLLQLDERCISLECDRSLVARAARTQEMLWVNGVSLESVESGLKVAQAGSEIAVPLITRNTLIGVLDIQDNRSDRFSKTDLDTFNTLAGQIATALENARLFEEMQKAEERFRTIFEDAPIGMTLVSLDTYRSLQVNKALCEMLGYTESELTALTLQELTHPEDIEQDVRLFDRMAADAIASYQIEKRYLKSNQEILWGNLTATLIRDRNGTMRYCLGMIENITERKLVEAALQKSEAQYREKAQELEQALHELQQAQTQLIQTEKMSSLGQLVAGVAHEINNPVNFIFGNITPANEYLQDLLDLLNLYQQYYPCPTSEIQERIEEIELEFMVLDFQKILSSMRVGAERIRQIVLSLRNFSRLDESDMKSVNVHEGIDNTLMLLQNRLKEKPGHPEIKVIKEYGKLPLVECYAGQLNQVFMNLLTNAIDAMEESNRQRTLEETQNHLNTIWIRTAPLNRNWVEIRILDNGPGMSEAVRQKLFDPFFTTKAVGKGTGLGLSISYQIIVEKHKGKLQCISAPNKGAEFVIQIPIYYQS